MRILIVDDQPRARQSLRAVVTAWLRLDTIAEAADGAQAIARAEQILPDLILMDARMPGTDGIAATRAIKARWPHIKIIVLSMFPEYRSQALEAGADLFLGKADPPETLLSALRTLATDFL